MISKLIEKAVNRTLMERTIGGISEPELRDLVESANDELFRMLHQQEELDHTRTQIGEQRVAFKEELDRIRKDIASRRGFVESRPTRSREEVERSENEELVARIRRSFATLESFPPEVRRVEREVIARAFEVLEIARASAFEAGSANADERVQNLERRVAKLVQSLETTEEVLKRVSSMKQLDVGLESIYRVVQGLSPDELEIERKREMMKEIFRKNLELYETLFRAPRAGDGAAFAPPQVGGAA
jgi:hypothetical protein